MVDFAVLMKLTLLTKLTLLMKLNLNDEVFASERSEKPSAMVKFFNSTTVL
jgi:hypothetical protein